MWELYENTCYTQPYHKISKWHRPIPRSSQYLPHNLPVIRRYKRGAQIPRVISSRRSSPSYPITPRPIFFPLTRRSESHTPTQHHAKLIFVYFSDYVENSSLTAYTAVTTAVITDVSKELGSFIFKGKRSKQQECRANGEDKKYILTTCTEKLKSDSNFG